jgi:hypothetical protein
MGWRHFRFYDGLNTPVSIAGNAKFNNFYFDAAPFVPMFINQSSGIPLFTSCKVGPSSAPFNQSRVITTGVEPVPGYGNFKINSQANEVYGTREEWTVTNPRPTIETFATTAAIVTVKPNHTFKYPVPPNEKYKFDSLGLVILNNGSDVNFVGGVCTQLNVQTDSIEVSFVPVSIASIGYYAGGVHSINFAGSFIGDMTSGSPVVTNVVMDYGTIPNLVGQWIRMPLTSTGGLYLTFTDYQKVISYSGNTITLSSNAGFTIPGASFLNNSTKHIEFIGLPIGITNFPGSSPFLAKTTATYNLSSYEFTKAGFNAASSDNRKAEYIVKSPDGVQYFPRINISNSLTIADGTQGDAKMLTSDANGATSWKTFEVNPTYPSDDFNTNTNPVAGVRVTPVGGKTWRLIGGGLSNILATSGGVLYNVSGNTVNQENIVVDLPSLDFIGKWTIGTAGASGTQFATLHNVDPVNFIFVYLSTGQIVDYVAGSGTTVFAGSGTSVNGDVIKIKCVGTAISVYRNDVLLGSGTLSGSNNGKVAGYYTGGTATGTLDKFETFSINQFATSSDIHDSLSVFTGGVGGYTIQQIKDSLGLDTTIHSRAFQSTSSTGFNIDTVYFSSSADERIIIEMDALAGKVSGGTYTCKKRITYSQIGGVYTTGTPVSIIPDEYLTDASSLSTYTIGFGRTGGRIFIVCSPESATINGQIEYRVKRLKL